MSATSRGHRNLLIISYLFPPMGGIAVQRALSLAKYLPNCGFNVHVLTARNAAGPVYDPGLLRHVPPEVKVHTAFTPEIPFHVRHKLWSMIGKRREAKQGTPARSVANPPLAARIVQRVLCPEPEVLWVPFALRQARKIIQCEQIDAVMVTAPPFSVFLVATQLKRLFPHVRLIADFRDEWLTFYLNNNEFQRGEYTRRRAAQIERETVAAADLVVAVTHSSLAEIQRRYPEQPPCKFHCVANGFDPEAFSDFRPKAHGGTKMIVTHVGTAYSNASPRYYLDAVDKLPTEVRANIRTQFIGRITDSERGLFEGRGSEVDLLGFMPHAEAVKYMEETDYLLLTMTDRISMPGKYYEYLATGKPILAISPAGSEVDAMIRQTGGGWCADPNNPEDIRRMLSAAYAVVRSGASRPIPHKSVMEFHERPRLAAQYASLINGAQLRAAPVLT